MKHFMPTMNKGLRKQIHKKYDTITINECNTSKKCCECYNNLEYYIHKNGDKPNEFNKMLDRKTTKTIMFSYFVFHLFKYSKGRGKS